MPSTSPLNERAAALARAKRGATALLLAVAALFVVGHLLGPGLGAAALRAVAEAALVGALADWFAVSALFRRIPLPIVSRHTDIIARNQARIGESLSAFLRDKFLDAPSLVALIRRHPPAALLARWLSAPENAQLLGRTAQRMAAALLDTVEDQRVQRFMADAVRAAIGRIDLTRSMAAVLGALTQGGRHQALLDDVIARLAERVNTPATHDFIAHTIVAWLKREHPKKELFLPSDWLGGKGASAIAHAVEALLADIARDPAHELRGALDAAVARLIERLQDDPDWQRRAEDIRGWLQHDEKLAAYVQSLWRTLRERLQRDLQQDDSLVARKVAAMGQWLGDALAGDAALRERLDARLESWAAHIAPEVADTVAAHVRTTIERWSARDMAALVELHIGRDLQYIRVNGTLVGGLVGLVLFVLANASALLQALR